MTIARIGASRRGLLLGGTAALLALPRVARAAGWYRPPSVKR